MAKTHAGFILSVGTALTELCKKKVSIITDNLDHN